MNKLRITELEKKCIVDAVHNFDPEASVYLFGSRTDKRKKGGDIDLIVISDKIKKLDLAHIEWEIFKFIEERKIDFLLSPHDIKDSFIKMNLEKAVLLNEQVV